LQPRGVKLCHRSDLWAWSRFDEARNLDFHSYCWVREGGSVIVDPLPVCEHDREHIRSLGGVATVVVTNSDHTRGAEWFARSFGAALVGPAGERGRLGLEATRWVADGDEIVPGMIALEMEGSKTPGELALLVDGRTLITGDLIRSHRGGTLRLLPESKLSDPAAAVESVRRLLSHDIEAVLVGDGWPVFRDGRARLEELTALHDDGS